MSNIVGRLYSMSPDLIERERQDQERLLDRRAKLEASDDARDTMLLFLEDSLMRPRGGAGRKRERKIPRSVENGVNPSRCMKALERRGLVLGVLHGWFKLTGVGRAAAG